MGEGRRVKRGRVDWDIDIVEGNGEQEEWKAERRAKRESQD